MNAWVNSRNLTVIALVVVAVFSRLLPHPPNFTALGAASLFAGAVLADRKLALLVPLLTLWLSDLFINNFIYGHYFDSFVWAGEGVLWSYLAFGLIVLMGHYGRVSHGNARLAAGRLAIGGFAVALVFFALSNFGVWMAGGIYPMTFQGLLACYVAAIPFFGYTLAGNLFFIVALFGGWYWIRTFNPQLARRPVGIINHT